MSSKSFSQALWRSSRRYKIGHDLSPFSTNQKMVLFSSRGQGIFEDLQASRPASPRTSNCVLEDVLEYSTSDSYVVKLVVVSMTISVRNKPLHNHSKEIIYNTRIFSKSCFIFRKYCQKDKILLNTAEG